MRIHLLGTAGAAVLALAAASGVAQQPATPPPTRPPEEQTVRTKDGWTLPISYYAVPSKETPVVILLHGGDGNRGVWRGFAQQLQQAKFAVVTVDLRKHGESEAPANANARPAKLTPADYRNMVNFDLEAVKEFLVEKHNAEQLNIRKTAIIAADDSAPVAINWALSDWLKDPYPDAPTLEARTPRGQDVRAIVLLSPSEAVSGLNLGRALPKLRNPAFGVAALIAVGELDQEDRDTASKSYERLTAGANEEGEKRVFLETYPQVKARGVELLGAARRSPGQILGFLENHLRKLPDTWQARKSRLR